MKTYEEVQAGSSGFYGCRNSLYLHVMDRSLKAFDRADKRRNRIKTKADFLKYQAAAKKKFVGLMGKIPYDKALPLEAKVTAATVLDGVRIENVIFQSRRDVYVTANLYIPEHTDGKLPGILLQCGHSPDGRHAFPYRRAALTIAKSGLVVLAMDPMGQGERRYYPEIFKNDSAASGVHQYYGNRCVLTGEALTKYFIADAKRGIDYLQSRSEVDADKIGATGVSGGGTMTAVMGVMDERIKAAAPGIFITTRRDYIYSGQWQDAEQIWFGATRENFDHYELVSCFCPKPYMILGAKSDFFCREGTEKVYAKSQEFYKLFGAQAHMRISWDDCTHMYSPKMATAAAEFFNAELKGERVCADVAELPQDYSPFVATKTGQLLRDGYTTLPACDPNKKEFLKKKCKNPKDALLKQIYNNRKACAFNVRHLDKDVVDGMAYEKMLWFSQEYMPCYAILFKPKDKADETLPVTVCLWSSGTKAILEHKDVLRKITESGRAAIVVDLSGMGSSAPHPNATCNTESLAARKLNADLLWLGDSLCAIRMFDLINTLDMLKDEYGVQEISMYTEGNFSNYADVLSKIGRGVPTECKNPISAYDVIAEKIYDPTELENIAMYGLGVYLK